MARGRRQRRRSDASGRMVESADAQPLWGICGRRASSGGVSASRTRRPDMTDPFATALAGALVGGVLASVGAWYGMRLVQSRDFHRRGRDAGRAVFYEMVLNRSALAASATIKHLIPQLSRDSLDDVMPTLAGWLSPK